MSVQADQINNGNNNLESKLDLILKKLDDDSKKNEKHFNEVILKLDNLEMCTVHIENRLEVVEEQSSTMINAVNELDTELNILQQERLSKNILVSGVPLKETKSDDLKVLFTEILVLLSDKISMDQVTYVGRFGNTDDEGRQVILVKLSKR